MVSRHNSRTSGFMHLPGSNSNRDDNDGIPLAQVRSNASTGARKPNANTHNPNSVSFDSSTNENENEKKEQHAGFFHRHHGRRKKVGDKPLGRSGTGDSEDGEARLNTMGKIYSKIVGYSVVTRYMVYVVPVGILLAVPLIVLAILGHKEDIPVGSTRNSDGDRVFGPPLFKLLMWIEITWLTLWAGKIVAWLLPKVFMFFCGIVSKGTRKYATVLENLSITLSLFFWLLATWLTFQNLFSPSRDRNIGWAQTLETVLGALFACSAVLLGEKAIVQLIGISYHQRSFANRIKNSKRDVYLLGLLYDASRTLFPMYCQEFAEEDYVIDDSLEMMLRNKAGRPKSGVATPMKLIGDVGRVGNKVTSVFGNIASEITGKKVFNPNSAHSIVLQALEKLGPSEALGRRIWMSFVVEGRDALYLDDFQEVLGPAYKRDAEEAFNAIDSDQNGDISLDEMVRKVVDVGKERNAISEGMKDIGQALEAFDKILMFVWLLISVFIFLAFFRSSFVVVVASAGTALLSLSFIFAGTTQEFLGSCIFLFVKHPYDVGDRVDINDKQFVVERISLLYTMFHRIDTMQITQIPNIILNNLWIDNISRSKAMYECINVDVSYDTTFEDVELLRLEMEKFVREPDNARDFQPDFDISVTSVGNLDKLSLCVVIQHKSNWHNDSVRATRRSKFMCALALALKKVPIYGPGGGYEALGAPGNPSYSVAVTDDWAVKSRGQAAQDKDGLRLIPSQRPADNQEALERDAKAADNLNDKPVVPETAGQWEAMREERIDRLSSQQPLSPSQTSEAAEERRRSHEIGVMRSDLLKRASTRGRRRQGESVPTLNTMDNDTGAPLNPTQSGRSPRLETFDEESATGMPSSYYDLTRGQSNTAAASTGREQQAGVPPQGSLTQQRGQQQQPGGQSQGWRDPTAGQR